MTAWYNYIIIATFEGLKQPLGLKQPQGLKQLLLVSGAAPFQCFKNCFILFQAVSNCFNLFNLLKLLNKGGWVGVCARVCVCIKYGSQNYCSEL